MWYARPRRMSSASARPPPSPHSACAVSSAALAVTAAPGRCRARRPPASPVAADVARLRRRVRHRSPSTGGGNGHGHGMSQYGAQGAAIAGLSTAARSSRSTTRHDADHARRRARIRVQLLGATGPTPPCSPAPPGSRSPGTARCRTTGYTQFRLVPHGSGLRAAGAQGPAGTWHRCRTSAAGARRLQQHRRLGPAVARRRVVHALPRHGRRACAAARASITINRVVARQLHAGRRAARDAGVLARRPRSARRPIAARTYGRNAVESQRAAASYDICDTTSARCTAGWQHYSRRRHAALDRRPGRDRRQREQGAALRRAHDLRAVQRVQRRRDARPAASRIWWQDRPVRQRDVRRPVPGLVGLDRRHRRSPAYYGLSTVTSIAGHRTQRVRAVGRLGARSAGQRHDVVRRGGARLDEREQPRVARWVCDDGVLPARTTQRCRQVRRSRCGPKSVDSAAIVTWSAPASSTGERAIRLSWGRHRLTVPGTAALGVRGRRCGRR